MRGESYEVLSLKRKELVNATRGFDAPWIWVIKKERNSAFLFPMADKDFCLSGVELLLDIFTLKIAREKIY